MRCIVTGGAGFIGSHLVDKLIEQNHEVIVIDNFITGKKSNLNSQATLWRKEDVGGSNLQDFFHWGGDIPKPPIDVIFHLAAMPRIQPSLQSPWGTYDINSTGTIVALEIARKYNARFVYASSPYYDPFINPHDYTKCLGEMHCKLYRRLYSVPVAVARIFSCYGPRQIDKGGMASVMGIFERQYRKGKPLTVTGDGAQRRDMIHVSDVVAGLIVMSKEDQNGAIFDLGTGKSHSILEVAELFGTKIEFIPARSGEVEVTKANTKFAKKILDWSAKIKLSDYINKIVSK